MFARIISRNPRQRESDFLNTETEQDIAREIQSYLHKGEIPVTRLIDKGEGYEKLLNDIYTFLEEAEIGYLSNSGDILIVKKGVKVDIAIYDVGLV